MLFALQNNGQLHSINPITESRNLNIVKLQNNGFIDFNSSCGIMVSIGEIGKGSLYRTRFSDEIFFSSSPTHNPMRKNSKILKGPIHENLEINYGFNMLKDWTMH